MSSSGSAQYDLAAYCLAQDRQAAFLCMLGGWLAATVAWSRGWSLPFYPGLAVSAAIWACGKFSKSRGWPSRGQDPAFP